MAEPLRIYLDFDAEMVDEILGAYGMGAKRFCLRAFSIICRMAADRDRAAFSA